MTRTAGAPIGCQRPSRFWGLGCPKIYHEAEDTLGHAHVVRGADGRVHGKAHPKKQRQLQQTVIANPQGRYRHH
ncbi:hypothetical protein, partial [Thiolapillus sp.]|uniref:hypothetical protein n=1 Tax=Thiolapillus sp. TaxID=2017437 RepID=UPI003AF5A0F9